MSRSRPLVRCALLACFAIAGGPPAADATFPGGNGRIVFEARYLDDVGLHDYLLGDLSARGTEAHEIRRCDFMSCPVGLGRPAVSPDGTRIAIGADGQLAILGWDGVTIQTLPRQTHYDWAPAWSPDGEQIAFMGSTPAFEGRYPSMRSEIYVVGADGTGLRQLTHRGGRWPAWSTRGRIAFERRDDIYTVTTTGGDLRRITYKRGERPSWSPDGRQLAFHRDTSGDRYTHLHDVFVVRADGRRLRRLTYRGGERPVWSPDGREMLFERRAWRYRSSKLMVLRLDGRSRLRTVSPLSYEFDPDWQAVPSG